MDTTLKQDIYERWIPLPRAEAGRELTADLIVPDSMPDAETVADAHGVLCISGKDTAAGSVTLTGTISTSVLYAPPGGGALQCVELELPVELRLEVPEADEDCRTQAELQLCSLEARAVNSRKLAVRAEVRAAARCWRRESLTLASAMAQADAPAHTLCRTAQVLTVSDLRERAYAATDEFPVPPGLADGIRLLSRRVELRSDDARYVRGKGVFRGRAVCELILADAEGTVRALRHEAEFTQIMELDCDAEDALLTASPLLTGAFFDLPAYGEGAGRITAEIHFTIQCICREQRRLPYLADVYANRTLLIPAFSETAAVSDARPVSLRQTVAGRAEPPAEGELLCVSASLSPAAAEEDGTVKTSVLVRLASRTAEGVCVISKCRLAAEFTPSELPDGGRLTDIDVSIADVYAAGSDVRVVLRMDALAVTETAIRSVTALEEDPEGYRALPRKPSVTLVRAAPGTELWALARRCGSSPEAILEANDGRREGLLLIPKTR